MKPILGETIKYFYKEILADLECHQRHTIKLNSIFKQDNDDRTGYHDSCSH